LQKEKHHDLRQELTRMLADIQWFFVSSFCAWTFLKNYYITLKSFSVPQECCD
jgi:hypothetical protein